VSLGRGPVIEIKTPDELAKMREAGRIVAQVLQVLENSVRPGISTGELDKIAADEIRRRKAEPAFLNYGGFPNTLCASVNEEVVHGIPNNHRVLKEGDIISLDMGAKLDGYYGDSAITVPVGRISESTAKLLAVTKQSLYCGIDAVKHGARLGDISRAVQDYAEANGTSVVRDFVGHGIGRHLHEEPPVPNYGDEGTGPLLKPGMVLAIEPMLNAGTYDVYVQKNGWTVVTADGKMSAHFEHTVAVTEQGPEIMTAL